MATQPTYPAALLERARQIRLIGFDVDGTLTDGSLGITSDGHELKQFHVHDGMGLTLLSRNGIETALVSARNSAATITRGKELKIPHVHAGERDKLGCMQNIAQAMGIDMSQVAFMGDDLPDLTVLRGVGLAIVPANAHPWVLPAAHWITPHAGGHGAARDACDLLLHAQGKVEAILANVGGLPADHRQ